MAAFERFSNVYDVALKPRLLRTLLNEQVPDEDRCLRDPSDLSSIVSTIRFHKLLFEESSSFDASTAASATATAIDKKKHVERWKSAVDAFVDRTLKLVSSGDMPDKCWAGICLLGVTCSECADSRFLQSYAVWFDALLSHIQQAGGSQFVKVASCASASDLLTRLGRFPSVKKDATSQAGKLVLPILKLLNDDNSAAVWEVAVSLLLTIITFFPSSVHRHYDIVESALVTKIMIGNCNPDLLKKLAWCLALLPKSRGDADSWFQMLRKICLSINIQLNEALEGLEEESKRDEAALLLVPPGEDPPPPLGGQIMGKDAPRASVNAPQRSLAPTISSLMHCCSTMLARPYPVQVTVPVRALIVMIRRILFVDGSLPRSFPYATAMQQESVCYQLPTLHLHSLEVLAAVVKGVHSQLLPYTADVVRLLMEYLRRCRFSELRIKVYSIIKDLLVSMGVGIALYLSQETINSAFADLNIVDRVASHVILKSCTGVSLQPNKKKRKHATTMLCEEQHNALNVQVEAPKECSTMIALKVAALETIEALLTVGGSLGNDSWRSKVDDLIISVALQACKTGWAWDNDVFFPSSPRTALGDYQLAALRALLASLIAPSRVRPPHLAQGFELFRIGKQAAGTKIAAFCAQALLALELLIHPRGLPLVDFPSPSTSAFTGRANSGYPLQNLLSNGGMSEAGLGESDEDDFLNDIYLHNHNAVASIPEAEEATHGVDAGKHPQGIDKSTDRKASDERGQSETSNAGTDRFQLPNDGKKFREPQPEPLPVPIREPQECGPCEDAMILPLVAKSESPRGRLKEDVRATKFQESATWDDWIPTKSDDDTVMLSHVVLDDNLSGDSFPDIVDGDPDSD